MPTVTVTKELKSEIIERMQIYTSDESCVVDPACPESKEGFDKYVAYLDSSDGSDETLSLDADLANTFMDDLEDSLRGCGEKRGKLYRAVCKFWVDSGRAVPLDIQAYKEGRAFCTGGIKGATWFTYNKIRYQAK